MYRSGRDPLGGGIKEQLERMCHLVAPNRPFMVSSHIATLHNAMLSSGQAQFGTRRKEKFNLVVVGVTWVCVDNSTLDLQLLLTVGQSKAVKNRPVKGPFNQLQSNLHVHDCCNPRRLMCTVSSDESLALCRGFSTR
jgi:hypothetical protein